jgi:hypothetical protein
MKKYIFPGTDEELAGLLRLLESGEKENESCSEFLARMLISKENYERMKEETEAETERLEEDDFIIDEDEFGEEEFIALYYFILDLIEKDDNNENFRSKIKRR